MITTPPEKRDAPPSRIIAADPVWALAEALIAEAGAQRDERFSGVLEDAARRIREAVAKGASLQDVGTAEAAPLLRMQADSVATACRRGRIPGARKIAGQWRIPVAAIEKGRAA